MPREGGSLKGQRRATLGSSGGIECQKRPPRRQNGGSLCHAASIGSFCWRRGHCSTPVRSSGSHRLTGSAPLLPSSLTKKRAFASAVVFGGRPPNFAKLSITILCLK